MTLGGACMAALKKPHWITDWKQHAPALGNARLRVGVTGLSRAGKTTFITSLINQLENHQRGLLARRPPFDRLEAVRWQRDGVGQAFACLDALRAVADNAARGPCSSAGL